MRDAAELRDARRGHAAEVRVKLDPRPVGMIGGEEHQRDDLALRLVAERGELVAAAQIGVDVGEDFRE